MNARVSRALRLCDATLCVLLSDSRHPQRRAHMDTSSAIEYLAASEGLRARPLARLEDLIAAQKGDKALPWFRIEAVQQQGSSSSTDSPTRRLAVTEMGGHAGHDNEPRLAYVCSFLQQRVLPLVRAPVAGYYRLELHDSYSYLPDSQLYRRAGALTFSRPAAGSAAAQHDTMALLPDPYQMGDYGGMLAARDTVPWAVKEPTLFFAGTTTGARRPRDNLRIRACVWALSQPRHVCRFSITNVAQMRSEDARAEWGAEAWDAVLGPPVPTEAHWRHRFQVNLVGNTACWSRVPMVLASSSLLVNVRHADATWYYPLLREGEHYAAVDTYDELPGMRKVLMADDARNQEMVRAAHRFCAAHLTAQHAAQYTARMLESAADHNLP